MKVTVVPAQVTTVEDRIAGNFSMSQVLLLSVPIFLGSFLYMILPPGMHGAIYKYIALGMLTLFCCILAVRIKGTIVLLWLIILLRYHGRPRRYVFTKQQLRGRPSEQSTQAQEEKTVVDAADELMPARLSERVRNEIEHVLEHEHTRLVLTTRKGGLYVRYTKAK